MRRRNTYPPKGRGSNYEREKYCHRCQTRTTHLYDHGQDMHVCQECEL